MVLTLLAILVAALVGLAVASAVAPRAVVTLGTAGIAGLAALLVLGSLVDAGQMTVLALPIGPPGGAMHLALDPLGAAFLLLLFVAVIPCAIHRAVFADAEPDAVPAHLPASRRRWLRWL